MVKLLFLLMRELKSYSPHCFDVVTSAGLTEFFAQVAYVLLQGTVGACLLYTSMCIRDSHDTMSTLEEKEQEITDALKSVLGIYAKISSVEPKSIVRSEGKAVRVIDKRNLYKNN